MSKRCFTWVLRTAVICFVLPFQGMSLETLYWGAAVEEEIRWFFSMHQEGVRTLVEQVLQKEGIAYGVQLEEEELPCQFFMALDATQTQRVDELLTSSFERLAASLPSEGAEKKTREWKFSFAPLQRRIMGGGVPKSAEAMPFFELPLTEEQKQVIRKLGIDLITKNLSELAKEKELLKKLIEEVKTIHPLRVLGFVLTDSALAPHLVAVAKTKTKWPMALKRVQGELRKLKDAGQLYPYVPGFADYVGLDKDRLQKLIEQDDFKGLCDYCLKS